MGASETYRYLVVLQHLHGGTGPVVRGIISQQHCRLSPLLIDGVKSLHQLLEEDLHDLVIGVALDQGVEYLSVGVHGGYDRDSGLGVSNGKALGALSPLPLGPSEVHHV